MISYLTVGEFWAFTIGWNIILEHMVGAAAVARSFSGYLDTLLGHGIQNATKAAVGTKILQTVSSSECTSRGRVFLKASTFSKEKRSQIIGVKIGVIFY